MRAGETGYTAHLIDGDDEMRRHRLDDVARPLTCHVVTSTAIVRPLGRCRCRAGVIFRVYVLFVASLLL